MINEFDKEIDSLLRQTASGGEAAFNGKSASNANSRTMHVDADEISLFAENALPVKARLRATEHLADCDRCRKILSGLITLNSETESENVHAREIVSAAAPVPWYKKLFAFPQIAYAMGALALIFSGVIALKVLQNSGESLSIGVAQNEAARETGDEATSANSAAAATPETYAMSNTTMTTTGNANSSANTMTAATNASTNSLAKTTAPLSNANNSNASLAGREETRAGEKTVAEQQLAVTGRNPQTESLGDLAMAKPAARSKKEDFVRDGPPPPPPIKAENEYRFDKDDSSRARQQTELVQNAPPVQNQASILPDSQSVKRSAPAARAENRKSVTTDGADTASEAKNKAPETRAAGGKVFRRADGVWYDAAYKGGQTTNIRRGTTEYKKLDKGLRSIADSIGGTIVVVWKSKAYRIQ